MSVTIVSLYGILDADDVDDAVVVVCVVGRVVVTPPDVVDGVDVVVVLEEVKKITAAPPAMIKMMTIAITTERVLEMLLLFEVKFIAGAKWQVVFSRLRNLHTQGIWGEILFL